MIYISNYYAINLNTAGRDPNPAEPCPETRSVYGRADDIGKAASSIW